MLATCVAVSFIPAMNLASSAGRPIVSSAQSLPVTRASRPCTAALYRSFISLACLAFRVRSTFLKCTLGAALLTYQSRLLSCAACPVWNSNLKYPIGDRPLDRPGKVIHGMCSIRSFGTRRPFQKNTGGSSGWSSWNTDPGVSHWTASGRARSFQDVTRP